MSGGRLGAVGPGCCHQPGSPFLPSGMPSCAAVPGPGACNWHIHAWVAAAAPAPPDMEPSPGPSACFCARRSIFTMLPGSPAARQRCGEASPCRPRACAPPRCGRARWIAPRSRPPHRLLLPTGRWRRRGRAAARRAPAVPPAMQLSIQFDARSASTQLPPACGPMPWMLLPHLRHRCGCRRSAAGGASAWCCCSRAAW